MGTLTLALRHLCLRARALGDPSRARGSGGAALQDVGHLYHCRVLCMLWLQDGSPCHNLVWQPFSELQLCCNEQKNVTSGKGCVQKKGVEWGGVLRGGTSKSCVAKEKSICRVSVWIIVPIKPFRISSTHYYVNKCGRPTTTATSTATPTATPTHNSMHNSMGTSTATWSATSAVVTTASSTVASTARLSFVFPLHFLPLFSIIPAFVIRQLVFNPLDGSISEYSVR